MQENREGVMMEIFERNEIKNLSRQSGLWLKNKEITALQGDLKELSAYLKKLEEIEIPEIDQAIEEGYWMHQNKTSLRKDQVETFDQKELLRTNAPKRNQNYVTVPKVMK